MAAAVNYTKSFSTVLFEAASPKEGAIKDLLKAWGYFWKWVQIFDPELSANCVACGEVGANGKNLLSGLQAAKNAYETIQSTGKLFTEYSGASSDARYKMRYTAIKNVCDLSNNVGDFTKLLSRFFTIPHIKHVEGVSGAFTFVGAINNIWEHAKLLLNPDKSQDEQMQFYNGVYNVINLISDICYGIVGTLVVLVWLGFITVPPVAILLPLTVALVCSLTNFFFKNLVNLNGKFPDIEKAIDAVQYKQTHKCLPQAVQV